MKYPRYWSIRNGDFALSTIEPPPGIHRGVWVHRNDDMYHHHVMRFASEADALRYMMDGSRQWEEKRGFYPHEVIAAVQ